LIRIGPKTAYNGIEWPLQSAAFVGHSGPYDLNPHYCLRLHCVGGLLLYPKLRKHCFGVRNHGLGLDRIAAVFWCCWADLEYIVCRMLPGYDDCVSCLSFWLCDQFKNIARLAQLWRITKCVEASWKRLRLGVAFAYIISVPYLPETYWVPLRVSMTRPHSDPVYAKNCGEPAVVFCWPDSWVGPRGFTPWKNEQMTVG